MRLECNNTLTTLNLSGSSTVYPVAKVWAYNFIEFANFRRECVDIFIGVGGSSTGARELCGGEVDIGVC